jgi:uncharacterized MAPEG superfamily protein
MRTQLLCLSVAAGILATTSCSSGPEPPKPGSPAFLWNAAKATYRSGDFVKTSETLQQLTRSDSEFAARARAWSIVVSAGLVQGYAETADTYEAGARANRANPTPFRKEVNQLRSRASAAAVEFAESVHTFLERDKGPTVLLAFEHPTGAAAQPGGLRKVSSGAWIQDSERELLLTSMLQRGVLLSAGRAAGSPDDPAKTLETLKSGEAQAPRPVFLTAVAKMLFDSSELFGSMKMDQPNRLRLLCQEASEALQGVPESKETKALTTKIQAALKKIKATT